MPTILRKWHASKYPSTTVSCSIKITYHYAFCANWGTLWVAQGLVSGVWRVALLVAIHLMYLNAKIIE